VACPWVYALGGALLPLSRRLRGIFWANRWAVKAVSLLKDAWLGSSRFEGNRRATMREIRIHSPAGRRELAVIGTSFDTRSRDWDMQHRPQSRVFGQTRLAWRTKCILNGLLLIELLPRGLGMWYCFRLAAAWASSRPAQKCVQRTTAVRSKQSSGAHAMHRTPRPSPGEINRKQDQP
jgi:hypothetical protein